MSAQLRFWKQLVVHFSQPLCRIIVANNVRTEMVWVQDWDLKPRAEICSDASRRSVPIAAASGYKSSFLIPEIIMLLCFKMGGSNHLL